MFRRQVMLFVMTLILGLGASSFSQAQTREQDLLNSLPKEFSQFRAESVVYYGSASGGYSRNYVYPGVAKITVYLYTAGQKRIDDGVSDATVRAEFQGARAAIEDAVKMGFYSNLRPLKQYGVTVPRALKGKGSLPFLVASYSYRMKNNPEPVYSRVYVTGIHNLVFKIRVTQAKEGNPSEADIQKFLAMAIDTFDRSVQK